MHKPTEVAVVYKEKQSEYVPSKFPHITSFCHRKILVQFLIAITYWFEDDAESLQSILL